MKSKNKQNQEEEEPPQMKRLIYVLNYINQNKSKDRISEIVLKSKRTDLIVICEEEVLQYAEDHDLYINPEKVDPKKKIPEGVPTELTEKLRLKLYRKYIREQDKLSEEHLFNVFEAESKNKAPPIDPRFDQKKDKKKEKKKKGEVEEEEEKELEDTTLEITGDYHYIYIMTDFGIAEKEFKILKKYENVVFINTLFKGVQKKVKEDSFAQDMQLLDSQIKDAAKFEEDYRKRIQRYIEGQFKQEGSSEDQSDETYEERIEEFTKRIEDMVRACPTPESGIGTWSVYTIKFDWEAVTEKDLEIKWEFYFREQLLKFAVELSNKQKEYLEWLMGLDLVQVVDKDPEIIEKMRREKEEELARLEQERLEREREEAEKLAKKKKPPKAKKKKGKGKKGEEDTEKTEGKEEQPQEGADGQKQDGDDGSKSKVKELPPQSYTQFEVLDTQISTLGASQITPGVFLEGYIDELNVREFGELFSQESRRDSSDPYETKNQINSYLEAVFDTLTSDKMVDQNEAIFKQEDIDKNTSTLKSSAYNIYEDLDVLSTTLGDCVLNNQDKLLPREKLIFENIKFDEIERLCSMTQGPEALVQQSLESTELNSKIQWDLEEFTRKGYLIKFEEIFTGAEPLKQWDFSDRIYMEKLTEFTLKQQLLTLFGSDPDFVTHYEEKLGLLYLGIYKKMPPGLKYYKKWRNPARLVPSFKTWDRLYREREKEADAEDLRFINLSEDDYGEIGENRSLFFPNDGAVIDVRVLKACHKTKARISIKKDRMCFGIKDNYPGYSSSFELHSGALESKRTQQLTQREKSAGVVEASKADGAVAENSAGVLKEGTFGSDEVPGSAKPKKKVVKKVTIIDERDKIKKNAEGGGGTTRRTGAGEEEEDDSDEEGGLTTGRTTLRTIESSVGGEQSELEAKDTHCEFWYCYDSGTRVHVDLEEIVVQEKTRRLEAKMMRGKEIPEKQKLSCATFTLKSGVIIKINGNRDIMMFPNHQHKSKPQKLLEAIGLAHYALSDITETSRIVTEEGAVIKRLSDGGSVIMYPSGRMDVTRSGLFFKSISLDGNFLNSKSELEDWSYNKDDVIKSSKKIDPDTGITSVVREDKFISFLYPDGKQVHNFPDDTRITVSPDGVKITVEHPGYPKFVTRFDKFRARNPSIIGNGSSFASQGDKNIFERSYTGRISSLVLEDGTLINCYQEMRELADFSSFRLTSVFLVYGYDGSIMKIEGQGELVLLDALDFIDVDRVELSRANISTINMNKSGIRPPSSNGSLVLEEATGLKGVESNYFIHLFLPIIEKGQGVYTVDLGDRVVVTKDRQGNRFKVRSDGEVQSKIAISFNLDGKEDKWDKFPKFEGSEFIEKKNLDLPAPQNWNEPYLILVNKDRTAYSFYTERMLSAYWSQKSLQNSRIVTVNGANNSSVGMMVLTTHPDPEESKKLPALPDTPSEFNPLPKTTLGLFKTQVKNLNLRILKKFDVLTEDDRKMRNFVTDELNRFEEQKINFQEKKKIWDRSKDQEEEEFDMQQTIMVLGDDNILVYNHANADEISHENKVIFVTSGEND